MGRAGLPMALIRDEQKRNQAFRNRRKGLIQKCEELSKLCDVNVGAISFPHLGSKQRRFKIETFPNDADEVMRIVGEFQLKRRKNMDNAKNHSTFASILHDKTVKLGQELEQLISMQGVGKDGGGPSNRPFFSTDAKHFQGMTEASLRTMAAQIGEKIVSLEPAIEHMRMVMMPNKTEPFCHVDQNDPFLHSQPYLDCKMPINPHMGYDNIDMMAALCKPQVPLKYLSIFSQLGSQCAYLVEPSHVPAMEAYNIGYNNAGSNDFKIYLESYLRTDLQQLPPAIGSSNLMSVGLGMAPIRRS